MRQLALMRHGAIVLFVVAGLFVWFFADALFGRGVFVFRDAGHYYYPLFRLVKSEWMAGRVPLWNPYENLGVPLAGNATSSVFYPGTLIFLLPLDYAWAYKLYVMGHVLLAVAAAYWLARHWGGSVEASGVGAISYAFSGNVLFQYCNVVFLVGAAWLPLAVLAADRMLTERSGFRVQGSGDPDRRPAVGGLTRVRSALVLGVVLALMTLGGNAEMAYHAGLIAAMYALWPARRPFSPGGHAGALATAQGPCCLATRLAGSRPGLLILAAATGLILSAVQVLPSLELSRLSGRAASPVARSLYELPRHMLGGTPTSQGDAAGWADGLTCRRVEPGTHHEHVYHFSIGPWRLGEYLWPNFSGRQFPVHRRWLDVIPGEGRIWVPSLYMGLLPLVLALAAMRLRGGSTREGWLSWLAVLSLVASFGWYGLGWLVEELRAAAGADVAGPPWVGAPFGGLYWLMTVLLPGYVYFRYPAKLLVITALALSMLAVHGWDRAFENPSVRLRRGLLWLGGVSLLGAVVVLALFPLRHRLLDGVGPNVLFGPLDTTGAAVDLLLAFVQTAVLCGAGWWLLCRRAGGARWARAAALVLVAVDLAVANGWMVVCAPAGQWQQRPKLAAVLQAEQARRGDAGPYRVFRHPIWMPPSWSAAGSTWRLADAMRWDRDTLWPKYNLAEAIPLAEVHGTMKPFDYGVLLLAERSKRGPSPFFLDVVNAKYVILRASDRMPGLEPIELDQTEAEGLEDVSLWHNPGHLPRAWIVHQVDVLPPLGSNDPHEVWRRTEQVFYPAGRPRNLRESAVVEADGDTRSIRDAETASDLGSAGVVVSLEESCRIVRYEPARVEVEADLKRAGLVVLCDQFYPGWRLEVDTQREGTREMPILRTNRVMRGAWLPAGCHRLSYRYRPASVLWGAWLSGLGWIGLGAIGTAGVVLRR